MQWVGPSESARRRHLKRLVAAADSVRMTEGRPHQSASTPGASSEPGLVMVADRDALFRRATARALRGCGFTVTTAADSDALERALADPGVAVVVVDPQIRGGLVSELLSTILGERSELQILITQTDATAAFAVSCMRGGAFDVVSKPFRELEPLRRSVGEALERARWARSALSGLGIDPSFPELIGRSQAMRRLLRTIESLRHSESHVLIQGESGTGKELVARAVHGVSARTASPFVPVDCGALPESVIESELFGHEKGAFTGAVGAPGLFRMAEGGTLFLDEIGEVPISVQAKLLRALQYKEVRPVGGGNPKPVNLRVITATHRDLAAMVDVGRFRTDLYYRLNVIRIEIPSLRERREDIPLLVNHFLTKYAKAGQGPTGIEDEALAALVHHDWPGNVRELENAIESALVFARGEELRVSDIPMARARPAVMQSPSLQQLPLSLEAYERSALERALREAGGNATEAARRLGIGRSTFYRKLSKSPDSPDESSGAPNAGSAGSNSDSGVGPNEPIR